MRLAIGGMVAGMAATGFAGRARAANSKTGVTPDQALDKLRQGNLRFMSEPQACVADLAQARQRVAEGQAPWASVLTCADSRVAPELVFGGLGPGDIFVCRNAGNIADTVVLGTLEYGVIALGSPLIMVIGHARCGAVAAACDVVIKKQKFPGSIGPMLKPILPAALAVAQKSGDVIDLAIRENARRQAEHVMSSSSIIAKAVKAGKVKIVAAYYSLDDGKVEILS
jgi:carbonic anhydrase